MAAKILRITIGMVIIFAMLLIVFSFKGINKASNNKTWEGYGTVDDPYIISTVDDLLLLSKRVQEGELFKGEYFSQVNDIDLSGLEWIPIGVYSSGYYFSGFYNGNNHCIQNLTILNESDEVTNVGLFGALAGTVVNLGIESGELHGTYVGAIAAASSGEASSIVNCYNKATLIGTQRAGGIADYFSNGDIINCINLGAVQAPVQGEIIAYSARNIMNISPVEQAWNDNFSGAYFQCIDDESDIRFLNKGIGYFEENEMFENDLLSRWEY